ncbi:MAG: restriction endonuclease [Gammaproteobacteria bacterium]|nr:restriction endonuclease [Gammaproteobacteria bacterium]
MKKQSKKIIVKNIRKYFEDEIFLNHKKKSLNDNAKLKSYKINPITVRYLSKVLDDNYTAEGIAKALYYPRVLGTSINTSFGGRIQKMFVELGLAEASLIDEMDIEFIDKVDNRRKYCQLKSGPNTINSGDVSPILTKFNAVVNRARTNSKMNLVNNDLVLGVLYGNSEELSAHYKKIDKKFPVFTGTDFWYRLTGHKNIYKNLVVELDELIFSLPTDDFLNVGWKKLAKEIEASPLFDNK